MLKERALVSYSWFLRKEAIDGKNEEIQPTKQVVISWAKALQDQVFLKSMVLDERTYTYIPIPHKLYIQVDWIFSNDTPYMFKASLYNNVDWIGL